MAAPVSYPRLSSARPGRMRIWGTRMLAWGALVAALGAIWLIVDTFG